jgi:hypothetical protein
VTVINGQIDSIIATITAGSGPYAFCWNALQNRTYVANYYSYSVSVIRDSMVSGVAEDIENCKLKIDNFLVYPNPAKTYLAIRNQLPADHLKIFDVMGNIVKSVELKGKNGQEIRISLDGIKNGIYFMQLDSQATTKKLVITK